MRENLDDSLKLLFGHEGGYVNHPSDPGGPTKFGITHKTLAAHRGVSSVSAAQVKSMTLEEAKEIYRKSYWAQSGGDLLPSGLDFLVFDMGVNAGPATAVKILQRLLGFKGKDVDGIIGVKTADAAEKWRNGVMDLIEEYSAARLRYYKSLSTWGKFGRGWERRVNESREQAITLAAGGRVARQEFVADTSTPKASPEADKASRDPMTYLVGAQPVLGAVLAATPENGPMPWFVGAAMFVLALAAVFLLVQKKKEAEA